MRIAFFTDTFKPSVNGVVDVVWKVSKELAKKGHEIHILGLSTKNENELIEGVHVHKFKGREFKFYNDFMIKYLPPLKRALRIINENKIEIIHSHLNLSMGLTAVIISAFKKIPLITTFHTLTPEFFFKIYPKEFNKRTDYKKPSLLKVFERMRIEKAITNFYYKTSWWWMSYFQITKRIIVPSNYAKLILKQKGFKNKILVIPNPVENNSERKTKKDKKLLLHSGRLSPEKRVSILIESMKNINAELIITSKGPEKEYLEKLSKKNGLENKIRFTGFLKKEEYNKVFDKAYLFISPAEYDTFNNCVAKSLMHKTPAVISRNSGATDFVKDGFNGVVLEKMNSENLSKTINELLRNKKLYNKLKNNTKSIHNLVNLNKIIKDYESIYKKTKYHGLSFKNALKYLTASMLINSLIILASLIERRS